MAERYILADACCDPQALERPTDDTFDGDGDSADERPATAGVEVPVGRRALLRGAATLGLAAAAGAATGLLGPARGVEAAHGASNFASADAAVPPVHAQNTGTTGTGAAPAIGVLADVSATGVGNGVRGIAPGAGNGVLGIQQATSPTGAGATTALGVAVQGIGCCGVAGVKPNWSDTVGSAVWGRAIKNDNTGPASLGVLGTKGFPAFPAEGTPPNSGVYGRTFVPGGAGVVARANADADALRVHGRALFSSVGAAMVTKGARSAVVTAPATTALSHVAVTLTGDPSPNGEGDDDDTDEGRGAAAVWVERSPGVGFTVHLSRRVRAETPFTYFIVEPAI